MRKSIRYSSIVIAALMAVAPVASFSHFESSTVQAASSTKKLTHNAAVYNAKGKRVGKKTLKKNKKVRILGTKRINGKAYYKIGKNSYVRTANFKKVVKSNAKKSSSTSEEDSFVEEMKKRSSDPTLNNYRDQVLKNSTSKDKVTVVFNKDSHSYYGDDEDLEVVDNIPAGTEITIVAPSIEKFGGEYYLSDTGEDNTNYYKLSDVSFNGYDPDHDAKLKSLQKQVDKMINKSEDGEVLITPNNGNVPMYESNGEGGLETKPSGVMSKPVRTGSVDVLRNNQKYYYSYSSYDGDYSVSVNDVTLSPAPADEDED